SPTVSLLIRYLFFSFRLRPPPLPTLFPYTTLFRSRVRGTVLAAEERRRLPAPRDRRAPARAHARPIRDRPSRPRRHPDSVLCLEDRKSTRLNSSHGSISYAVFCLKKKKTD